MSDYFGKEIPKLGFGLMRLPKKVIGTDIEQTKLMVDRFMNAGFTYFDTAYVYIGSEEAAKIAPALLQNKTHPYHQSGVMKEHISQYGTVMKSWFPLGGRGNTQRLFEDETISSIAEAHEKTSAQIILRWHLQAGNIAIPGSSNEAHTQENCEIFDFELTENEMKQMAALEHDERFSDY